MILFGFTKKSGAALVHPGTMLSQGPSCCCKAGLCKEHGNRQFLCFYSFCGYPGVGFETKLEDSCPVITASSDQRCVPIWMCLKIPKIRLFIISFPSELPFWGMPPCGFRCHLFQAHSKGSTASAGQSQAEAIVQAVQRRPL